MTREEKVLDLLKTIEAELKRVELWQLDAPSTEALASQEPFAVDTLSFTEWVQWIMLPRFEQLIQRGHTLPVQCSIYPMAEEALKGSDTKLLPFLKLIESLDNTITLHH